MEIYFYRLPHPKRLLSEYGCSLNVVNLRTSDRLYKGVHMLKSNIYLISDLEVVHNLKYFKGLVILKLRHQKHDNYHA